jgi:hypothetical protein
MASKVKHVMRLIGRRPKDVGTVMYHAATGVIDGGNTNSAKNHKLKKAFARLRRMPDSTRDEGTHRYSDEGKEGKADRSTEREATNWMNRS